MQISRALLGTKRNPTQKTTDCVVQSLYLPTFELKSQDLHFLYHLKPRF